MKELIANTDYSTKSWKEYSLILKRLIHFSEINASDFW